MCFDKLSTNATKAPYSLVLIISKPSFEAFEAHPIKWVWVPRLGVRIRGMVCCGALMVLLLPIMMLPLLSLSTEISLSATSSPLFDIAYS